MSQVCSAVEVAMIAVRPPRSVSPSSLGSSLSPYGKSIKLSTSSNSDQYPTMYASPIVRPWETEIVIGLTRIRSIKNVSYGATFPPTTVDEELESMSEPSPDVLLRVANRETNLSNSASNDMKSNVNLNPGGTGKGIVNTFQPELTVGELHSLIEKYFQNL